MNNKQWYRKWWIWAGSFILLFFPIAINESFKVYGWYETQWNAADALSYYGSFIGAAGTIILGIVAWELNKRLLRVEEDSFIANNACLGFVNNIKIINVKKKASTFEKHIEQIVSSIGVDFSGNDYSSFSLQVKVSMKENYAALVKIETILLIINCSDDRISVFNLKSIDNKFSRVTIYPNEIEFNVLMIVSPDEKADLIKSVNDFHSQLEIEVDFILLTDKYVTSNLKCRTTLSCRNYSKSEGIYNDFRIEEESQPQCFWYGNDILKKETVKIKQLQLTTD